MQHHNKIIEHILNLLYPTCQRVVHSYTSWLKTTQSQPKTTQSHPQSKSTRLKPPALQTPIHNVKPDHRDEEISPVE